MPDIFVYLTKDGRKTCHLRKSFKYFSEQIVEEPQLM